MSLEFCGFVFTICSSANTFINLDPNGSLPPVGAIKVEVILCTALATQSMFCMQMSKA